jgi:hypothetical protein
MYMDAQLLFSDAQAVTAAAASTNLVDLVATERRIGTGKPLYIVIGVDVAMTDSGSDSTIAVTLESDTTAAFASATNRQTLGTFAATSAIGTTIIAVVAPEILTERFIRLYYTPANGDLTTGSFTAFMTTEIQAFTGYPDGFTIGA